MTKGAISVLLTCDIFMLCPNTAFILCVSRTDFFFTIKTTGKTSNCSVCWFEISSIYHKFRVPRWVVQLLPAQFIAMHSLTIHHLLAPLIIWQKVITWHSAVLQSGTLTVIWPPEQQSGGEGGTTVQVWPQHYKWMHVHMHVADYMLLRLCKLCIRFLFIYCFPHNKSGK